jgi:amino acid adenylation domain-containing protein
VVGQRSRSGDSAHVAVDDAVERVVPCSFAQERFWVFDRLFPGTSFHVEYLTFDFAPDVDVDALRRALTSLAARHEPLRSGIVVVDGIPCQAVLRPDEVDLTVLDVRHLPPDRADDEARRRREEASLEPFDLGGGASLRAVLVVARGASTLILSTHQLFFDAWSRQIVAEDLSHLYRCEVAGSGPALPPLRVAYGDYARWQRRHFGGPDGEAALGRWVEALAGSPLVVPFPTDRERPAERSFEPAVVSFTIGTGAGRRMRRLVRDAGTTPFAGFLAALVVLLQRYTGEDDLIVGTYTWGRTHEELERLVGLFVNIVPVRVDGSGQPTFEDLVGRVHRSLLANHDRGEVPYERLVDRLVDDRDLRRAPIVQVVLSFLHAAGAAGAAEIAVRAGHEGVGSVAAILDIELELSEEDDGGYVGWLTFPSDIFDRATMERVAAHLVAIVDHVGHAPDTAVEDVRLATDDELGHVMAMGRGAHRVTPGATIHQLLGEQAARTPSRPAVVAGDEVVTYGRLAVSSNRIAHVLLESGATVGEVIGVHLRRGALLPAVLLGVLEAGGAFLLLDPDLPPLRLSHLVEDAGIRTVITEPALAGDARRLAGHVQVVVIDAAHLDGPPAAAVPTRATADSLAHVVYTSGSTGTPNGVEASHRATVSQLAWLDQLAPLQPGERCAHRTPLSFIDTIGEVFRPILSGATLVVVDHEAATDPRRLIDVVAEQRIARLTMVPSLLAAILEQPGVVGGLAGVRECFVSGEPVTPALARRFAELLPGARLWNLYGSTEVLDVTADLVSEGTDAVVVGKPLANAEAVVVDARGRLAPIGVPGELLLGGPSLATGYRGKPALTAERFVPHPLEPDGPLVYRSGDRVRWRSDGALQFLGRLDDQVKVRGHRIEIGEIEGLLRQHPAVAEAAVVARRGPNRSSARLDAYVVVVSPEPPLSTLRAFLRARLPAAVVPTGFAVVGTFARTPSGKVDRRALPPIDATAPPDEPREQLRGPTETIVARAWSDVLGVPDLGRHSNFFELGGESLAAVQVVAMLSDEIGAEVPLRLVFEWPVLAEFSTALADARAGHGDPR